MNDLRFYGLLTVFQARNGVKPTTRTLAGNPPMGDFSFGFEMCNGLFDKHQLQMVAKRRPSFL